MIPLKSLISELKVSDYSTPNEKTKYFIAWRDRLFILDDESDLSPTIEWLENHPTFDTKYGFNADTVYDLVSYASEMPPDVAVGQFNVDTKTLSIMGYDKTNPISSTILSKIIRQLGVKKVTRNASGEDDDELFSAKKNIADIPKIGFHGTNTINLLDIIKNGIVAGSVPGNFEHNDVFHETDSFFASVFGDAVFYAKHSTYDYSVRKWDGYKKKNDAYPVVVEFNVPDQADVIPDFDADAHSVGDRFFHHKNPPTHTGASSMKSMGLSKESGKFGYRGRISTGNFRFIYIYSELEKRWKKFKPTTVARGLSNMGINWYERINVVNY